MVTVRLREREGQFTRPVVDAPGHRIGVDAQVSSATLQTGAPGSQFSELALLLIEPVPLIALRYDASVGGSLRNLVRRREWLAVQRKAGLSPSVPGLFTPRFARTQ